MNDERLAAMRERLESALAPEFLDIIDDSHKHVGHAGARDGRGHFTVRIRAKALAGQAMLAQHRAIYAALGTMMETDIHALAIKVLGPEA
ncbi:BolA family transcriptional regulator [Ahniella affigens]|uniref:BolA family transcriptional regulator n=1 Tax=Ahniella affigens TaxID=2021234 RepID=A0A2P1PP23_9GAMM|nr:BolA family protein [Ahniella affigens]AVP96594.1 BolA family transcriptional regulator [Ahniella affigens]